MKIMVLFADGFEEVEALTVVDYLRRVQIDVDTVSITRDNVVRGAHNIRVVTDKFIESIAIDNYDGIVIPGGLLGATNLRDNNFVIEVVKAMHDEDKLIAAICAGPIVLAKAQIIKNRSITSFPGFEKDLLKANYKEEKVVVDGNIITSRGPYFAVDFAIAIIGYLQGDKKVSKLKTDILYNS